MTREATGTGPVKGTEIVTGTDIVAGTGTEAGIVIVTETERAERAGTADPGDPERGKATLAQLRADSAVLMHECTNL